MFRSISLNRKHGGPGGSWPEWLLPACALLFNPLVLFFNWTVMDFPSDAIAYLAFGREMIENGRLYLSGWGHPDTSVILPPLFPFLLAIGQMIAADDLKVAEWVSRICAVAAVFPLFYYMKAMANRWVAFVGILLIQINGWYFLIGMRPLSESLTLAVLGLQLVLSVKMVQSSGQGGKRLPVLVGMGCAMVFFSRQIGIVYPVFLTVFLAIQWIGASSPELRRGISRNLVWVLAGFFFLFLIYAAVLYHQTGSHPFRQHLKNEAARNAGLPQKVLAEIRQIQRIEETSYGVVYFKRRLMRKLMPDATEMYCNLDVDADKNDGVWAAISSALSRPGQYLRQVAGNISHLQSSIGWTAMVLFLGACVAPVWIRSNEWKTASRLILPGFILCYLLTISVFTDQLIRYVYILMPFALVQIAVEATIAFQRVSAGRRIGISGPLCLCLMGIGLLAGTPKVFTDIPSLPDLPVKGSAYQDLKNCASGQSIFSLSPFDAYLSGGKYRVLPNDSLEKVVRYARVTGVRWMLIDASGSVDGEIRMYCNAKWIASSSLEREYPGLVRLRATSPDNLLRLYEII